MKLATSIVAGLAAVCIMLCGTVTQAQPAITGVFPSGTYLYVPTNTFSFTASSAANVTNVSVQLNGTEFTTGRSVIRVLTPSGGLTITGPATSEAVNAPLTSNMLYTAAIQVWDANGATTTSNVSFSTIVPGYTFEAEDFNYTSNGISGLYIDNPQTNAYAGLASTSGSDYVNNVNQGNQDYRPQGLETEALNSDKPRLSRGGLQDYDVGWNNGGGGWGNYTRHYPAGAYYVYVRASNGNGQSADDANLSVVSGTASFAGTGPYTFSVPGVGWANYVWVPVLDANNNLAVFTSDGSASTIRVTTDNGNYNANFYMLMPTNANATIPGTAVVASFFPNGTYQFQETNQFVFNVISPVGVNPGDVVVQLTGTPLGGQSSTAVLTDGNGLNVTGFSTNLNASLSLNTNMAYAAFIQIIETNGNISSTNISFDTVYPGYYTFEAEDWNYNDGQFFDNPQTNAYEGLNGASGVDYVNPGGSGGQGDYARQGLNLDPTPTGDLPRVPYINTTNDLTGYPYEDFDVGNVSGGQWANYTRTFPSGVYNIYMRAADGNGASSDSASMDEVTSDRTQPNQSILNLGTFAVPATGGWQIYEWVPLKNSGGGLARFSGGSVETLRMAVDNGNYNANYFMLVPADLSHNDPPFVSDVWPDGSTMFQSTNKLSFVVNSDAGIATNNVVVSLNGHNATGLTFSGSPNLWSVTCPIQSNMAYSVIITLTDSTATVSSTNYFDTFDTNTAYTFETEDYDYGGGQFIDNPQPGGYAGLGGALNVDDYWDYNVGTGYRPSAGAGEGLSTESPSGDIIRPGYGSANYDIGHNDTGNWANYTRHYPAGTYNIWMRYASPNGSPNITDAAKISLVTGGWGTTGQTTTQLGTFTTHNTGGWGTYTGGWTPLIDGAGNNVQFVSDGTTNTLKYTVDGGGYNVDFFALVPANTNVPSITGLYPNGTNFLQYAKSLSFVVNSPSGVDTNSIVVTVDGTVVTGLVFTGSATSWNVSYPDLQANTNHTIEIQVTDSNGNIATTTVSFNDYSPMNYQWEAEDYDYSTNGVSGLFFDNPQVDDYAGLAGKAGVDFLEDDTAAFTRGYSYRATNGFPDTVANDGARSQFSAGKTDYSIGSFGGGSWADYTRNYPAGTYNVVGRFAEGAGTADITLSQVTGGYGTSNQMINALGTFVVPVGGWSTWEFVELTDGSGNPARVTLNGSQATLRLGGQDNEANINFFMLVPTTPSPSITATVSGGQITLSFPSESGYTYQAEYTDSLTAPDWQPVNGSTLISGDGSVKSVEDTISENNRYYRLEIQPNP